jgi:biotin operon repressor
MSVKVMSAVWELDLPQNQKLVLLAFADHADDDGVCYPSVGRIAWKTGVSERQVQRIVKKLRAAGLVVLLRHAQGGRGNAAVYQVQPQKGVKLSPFAGMSDIGKALSESKGCHSGQERVTSSAEKGDIAVSPEPSENHHTKPSEKPSCAERSKTDHSAQQVSPPAPAAVIELPLNDGSQHVVLPEAVAEWKHLYPAVDVMQELRNMRGWLLANREKRKTRRGIERFINAWLAKRQDKAGTEGINAGRKGDRRKTGGAYHSGDPTRTYEREPDLVVNVP